MGNSAFFFGWSLFIVLPGYNSEHVWEILASVKSYFEIVCPCDKVGSAQIWPVLSSCLTPAECFTVHRAWIFTCAQCFTGTEEQSVTFISSNITCISNSRRLVLVLERWTQSCFRKQEKSNKILIKLGSSALCEWHWFLCLQWSGSFSMQLLLAQPITWKRRILIAKAGLKVYK